MKNNKSTQSAFQIHVSDVGVCYLDSMLPLVSLAKMASPTALRLNLMPKFHVTGK